jgi:Protein of unknown function (DUF3987)
MTKPNLIELASDYLDSRFPGRLEYARGVSIALISAVSANSLKTDVTCPFTTRTNMYILVLGPTTTGKSTMINYGLEILDMIEYRNIITDDMTPESIPKYLSDNKHVLMRIGEMSKLLGSYKKKQYMSGLREMMIQTWDGSILSQGRSTRSHVDARDYAMCAIADTQPGILALSADESDISSGYLPRHYFAMAVNPSAVSPRVMSDYQLKQRIEIVERFKHLYWIATHNNVFFRFSQEQVDQIYERLKTSATTDMSMFQSFYDRGVDFVYKLSMLHMFGSENFLYKAAEWGEDENVGDWTSNVLQEREKERHKYALDIDSESVEWAIQFVQNYIDTVLPEIFKTLTLNDGEKVKDAVVAYKLEHDGKSMPESILYRLLVHSMRDGNRIRNAIHLAEKMHYVFPITGHGGRSYALYKDKKNGSVFDFVHEDSDPDEASTDPDSLDNLNNN